jgi:hypothetical protein
MIIEPAKSMVSSVTTVALLISQFPDAGGGVPVMDPPTLMGMKLKNTTRHSKTAKQLFFPIHFAPMHLLTYS